MDKREALKEVNHAITCINHFLKERKRYLAGQENTIPTEQYKTLCIEQIENYLKLFVIDRQPYYKVEYVINLKKPEFRYKIIDLGVE